MMKPPARQPAGNGGVLAAARWHRRLGIAAALVVAWLALTGIFLVHSDDLALDERAVGIGWLLDWYGIPPPDVAAYRVGDAWVVQAGERLYVNDRPVPGEYQELAGAVQFRDEVVAVAGSQLLLLSATGDLLEVLGEAHGVPGPIASIATEGSRLVVRTRGGEQYASTDLLAWRRAEAARAAWSEAAPAPDRLRERVAEHYRGQVLTLERLLLDLHSGRFFGALGVVIVDLAAIAFFVLAATGLWLWLARRPRNGRRR